MQDLAGSGSVSGGMAAAAVRTMPSRDTSQSLYCPCRDPRLASDLIKRVQGKPEGRKLEIIVNDVMKTELPPVDVCISNTPYQVSNFPHAKAADICIH